MLAMLSMCLASFLLLAAPAARAGSPPAEPAALPPHPLVAAELEGEGLTGRSAAPELLDYWLGPVAMTQDYLARDVVLLTRGQVAHVRVRAASVSELNARTLDLLTGTVSGVGGVPRRVPPVRLELAPGLARHEGLLRLLGQGVSEQVEEIRIGEPKQSASFLHVTLEYLAAGQRHTASAAAAQLETALLDGLVALFPGTGQL